MENQNTPVARVKKHLLTTTGQRGRLSIVNAPMNSIGTNYAEEKTRRE